MKGPEDGIDQDCNGTDLMIATEVNEGDVIFTEIMHNPVGALEEQSWVSCTIPLIDQSQEYLGGTDTEAEGYTIVNDIYLFQEDYVLFVANTDELTNGGIVNSDERFFMDKEQVNFPNEDGDVVSLRDSSGI